MRVILVTRSCVKKYLQLILKIRTDSLTTHIGVALAAVKAEEVEVVGADLLTILPMAYHVNGSVRGKLAVTEEDLSWLSDRYDFYARTCKGTNSKFCFATRHWGCNCASLMSE
ncbi:hypothetical protein LSPH24S_02657 [Lysinibacillus sphaericus]